MDKLQPLIKNRFWILGALTLPLAMYGFFSANGALKAATEQREATLKGLTIPPGTNNPNEDYKEKLAAINAEYEKNVETSIIDIWNRQKERMVWSPTVVLPNQVPDIFLDPNGFSLDITDAYRRFYPSLMLKLQERVEPVMPLDRGMGGVGGVGGVGAAATTQLPGRGGVVVEANVPWKQKVILAAELPIAQFDRLAVTSEQVWNAQVDIWLLELLFDAVRRMNEDKDSVTEAIIRRIDVIRLFGGSGQPPSAGGGEAAASSGGYGGGGYDSGGYGGGEYGSGGYGGGGAAQTGGAAGSLNSVNIAFDPTQEFGSTADTGAAAAESSSGGYGGYGGGYGGEYGGGYGGGGATAAAGGKQLRYIADSEEKTVLERGFYMSVIIMQNKIPDFIVELANSDWPIRVKRFHVGRNPYFTEAATSSPMRGGQYGSMGGSYGGGAYGSGGGGYDASGGYGSGSRGGGFGNLGGGYGAAGGQATKIPGVGGLSANLPSYAMGALNHPDLVQLDLCGVITIFKQPAEVVAALTAGTELPAGSSAVGENPEANSPAETQPENPEAMPASEESVPAEEPTTESEDIPATESVAPEETPATEAEPDGAEMSPTSSS